MSENQQVETVKTVRERTPRSKQKLKILYLVKILLENTDANHDITLQESINKLDAYGVTSERKSLYDDIAQLCDFGYKIERTQYDKTSHYRLISRDFELAEVKLLVDSVASAKFITEEKSNELIKKLETLTSRQNASMLQRQVHVAGRVKSMNDAILANVDVIHNAIASNSQISFQYFQWTVSRQQELRKNGERYKISPWGLSWDDENYYMVGYDVDADMIKHYRVDKMKQIELLEDRRDGKEAFKGFDMAAYSKMNFGMYSGRKEKVRIEFNNYMVGVFIDRFGKDISIIPAGDNSSCIHVDVAVSPQFFAWILSLGDEVKVTGPDSVVEEMKEYVRGFLERY